MIEDPAAAAAAADAGGESSRIESRAEMIQDRLKQRKKKKPCLHVHAYMSPLDGIVSQGPCVCSNHVER